MTSLYSFCFFFFSSRRRHTRLQGDWSSDVCSSDLDIVTEVQQHLGEGRVRCVSMKPTEGVVRGMKAYDTGGPITVPVGPGTPGRGMNVLGEPVGNLGPVHSEIRCPIHWPGPLLLGQSTQP